ncbi:MAG: heparinase II/III domain-containing protein, partial [Candidatus Promineifilaceae bacterium]
ETVNAPPSLTIEDFEDISDWSGLTQEDTIFKEGSYAGRWENHLETTLISKTFATAQDFSQMDYLGFWLHSSVANNAEISIILSSENPNETPAGWDYYIHEIMLDWSGWRYVELQRTDFDDARDPLGWHHINDIRIYAGGWGNTPQADSLLIFDEIVIIEEPLLIDNFENVSDWISLTLETTTITQTGNAGRWDNHVSNKSIRKTFAQPMDVSEADRVQFWMHSAVANNALIELIFDSANPDTNGIDNYRHTIRVDWTGWQRFEIPLGAFVSSRTPLGWHHINYVALYADGWEHTGLSDTILILDEMRFLPDPWLVDNFENVHDWTFVSAETTLVQTGNSAGRWFDPVEEPKIIKQFTPTIDASDADHLRFWMYSGVANDHRIMFTLDSNRAATEGWDYYRHAIALDWTGWRFFQIPLTDFIAEREPIGWQQINEIRIFSDWGSEPPAGTQVIFDDMRFGSDVISNIDVTTDYVNGNYVYIHTLALHDQLSVTRNLAIDVTSEGSVPFSTTVLRPYATLGANMTETVQIRTVITPAHAPLDNQRVLVTIKDASGVIDGTTLETATPLSMQAQANPRLLLNSADFTRINNLAATTPWAADVVDEIINSAENWEQTFTTTYHIDQWHLPPLGGQWSPYYTCPDNVTPLSYRAYKEHYCRTNGQVYTDNLTYDQVIYGKMFDDLAVAAQDLGLAYQLTGNTAYAAGATEILSALAASYTTYPYHDRYGGIAAGPGRVHAQTLNEAEWGYKIAWAYDLVAETLTSAEKHTIENDLLRQIATTIRRNERGLSNWQSWHNMALGAIGIAIDEPVLIDEALNDAQNGFYLQMEESVSDEGGWYEGSWGYHFYALQPTYLLAEMLMRSEVDLYSNPSLRNMFTIPLDIVQPDNRFPAFNDSRRNVSLDTQLPHYEIAHHRYPSETRFASLLQDSSRGRHGLFWGVETVVGSGSAEQPQSKVFPNTGIGILRNNMNLNRPLYLALDFGEHGSSHGHYDKLSYILYSDGKLHGIDSGISSYGSPMYDGWDKTTVAHNTVVVDMQNQRGVSGTLQTFDTEAGVSRISADAGEAYTHTKITRTMIMMDAFIIDQVVVSSDDVRQIDLVHHSEGKRDQTSLNLTAYAEFLVTDTAGYKHLTDAVADDVTAPWYATIDSTVGEQLVEDFNTSSSGLKIHGLSSDPTTVVLGKAPAPNGVAEQSFLMQRRTAQNTTFMTLLEPITDTARIEQATLLSTSQRENAFGIRVEYADYTDWLFSLNQTVFVFNTRGHSAMSYFDNAACNGSLCSIRRANDNLLQRTILIDGTRLEDNGRMLISTTHPIAMQVEYPQNETTLKLYASEAVTVPVFIYAPDVASVLLNDATIPFTRAGDVIILNQTTVPSAVQVQSISIVQDVNIPALLGIVTIMIGLLLITIKVISSALQDSKHQHI